ncbi:VOC family protein [Xanthobacter pseudotagetidis]|uniref:VOC family protein n=1 Tax=Xanthobacter pseudotagetidis TaxID=3119911 RepID=UPI00372BC67B
MAERAGSVIPYLTVGSALDAIAFYRQAFRAEETYKMMAEDGRRVLHARLRIGEGIVMLSDDFPEFGSGAIAPVPGARASVAVALALASAADVDATFARALAAGASGEMVPSDVFWGDRFATLADPFGHRWMLSAPQG